jgi:hypothetical protein
MRLIASSALHQGVDHCGTRETSSEWVDLLLLEVAAS